MNSHKNEKAARHIEEELRNAALNVAFEVRIMLDACEESVFDGVLEIIDKHITSWSGKRFGDPEVMGVLGDVRREIEALKEENGDDKERAH